MDKNDLIGAGYVALAIGCGVALGVSGLDFITSAEAAVTPTPTPVFAQVPRHTEVQVLNATGTTAVTLFTPGANGSKVNGLVCTSNDSSAETIDLEIVQNALTYILSGFSIAIGAGVTVGTAPLNAMSATLMPGLPVDSDGNPYLLLAGANQGATASEILQIVTTGTVTSGKTISCMVMGADF